MNWLIPVSVSIFVPLILARLAKIYPYKAPENLSIEDLENLKVKYRKTDILTGLGTLMLFILSCYLIGNLLYIINHLFIEVNKLIIFHVIPDHFWWNGFGIIFSFGATCSYLMMIVYKIILKENLNEYIIYNNLKSEFKSIKVVKYMGYFFMCFGLLGYCFLWNYNIKIYKDKMIIHWFLSVNDKPYKYDQIKSVSLIKNPTPHPLIIFKDGMDWNFQNGLDAGDKDSTILKFVSEKSGLKIDTLVEEPKY